MRQEDEFVVASGHSIFQIMECSAEMGMGCLQQRAVSILCDCRGNSRGFFCASGTKLNRISFLISVER